jgi:UDP-glucose 4-epimerase
MKILVTGGAGFIGSHIVDKYIENGFQVVVVDNLSTGDQKNINKKAKFYQIDIRDKNLSDILKIEKPDIINHHAAQISVTNSVQNPENDLDINAKGFLNLLNQAVFCNIKKIIYISSGGAIYGDAKEFPTSEKYLPEPISPYAIHKYLGEFYLKFFYNNFGMQYTILRYANVYGPRQTAKSEAGVISIFINNLLSNVQPTIFAYPDQPEGMIRDYVFVDDVVNVNLIALENFNNSVYNVGSGRQTNTANLLKIICDLMQVKYSPKFENFRPGEVKKSCLNIDKIMHELNWKPVFDLQNGLNKTIQFFKNIGV